MQTNPSRALGICPWQNLKPEQHLSFQHLLQHQLDQFLLLVVFLMLAVFLMLLVLLRFLGAEAEVEVEAEQHLPHPLSLGAETEAEEGTECEP